MADPANEHRIPILEPEPEKVPTRRATDIVLPTLYHFILSLVVILGCFGYLYAAKPDQLVSTAILGFVGAVIGYWFLRKGSASDS